MKEKKKPEVDTRAQAHFRLNNNSKRGVLLLHGFMGAPSEMHYLGEKIYDAGYSISIPRYPGHGTTLQEMVKTNARDWFTAAREAYLELCSHCEKVYVTGLSLGGLFTILLAEEFAIEKIVLISVPRRVQGYLIYATPIAGIFKKIWWVQDTIKGINSPLARKNHFNYDRGKPLRQASYLLATIYRAMSRLKHVKSPVLIVQSQGDEAISPDSAEYIYSRIASTEKKIIYFEKSNHVISVDYDRDDLARETIAFLSK